jgi:hypothetical protein
MKPFHHMRVYKKKSFLCEPEKKKIYEKSEIITCLERVTAFVSNARGQRCQSGRPWHMRTRAQTVKRTAERIATASIEQAPRTSPILASTWPPLVRRNQVLLTRVLLTQQVLPSQSQIHHVATRIPSPVTVVTREKPKRFAFGDNPLRHVCYIYTVWWIRCAGSWNGNTTTFRQTQQRQKTSN